MADINQNIDISINATVNSDKTIGEIVSIKKELREAQLEVVRMADKFGLTSKEAEIAAKKVADLKDRIGDAKQLSDTFNPDKKFVALQGALTGAVSGFSAVTGVMGLFGSKSEDVEKLLLKVNSAMALQQGISGIMGAVDSFKLLAATIEKNVVAAFTTMRGALISTGIGALIVGIGLLIANFDTLKDAVMGTTAEVKVLNETQKDFNKGVEDAATNVAKVTSAFALAEKGVISKKDALKIYNETLGDALGKQTDLTKAEQVVTDKAADYIKIMGLKAQANALFALSGQLVAKSLLAQTEDQTSWIDKTIAGFLGVSGGAYLVKEQIDGVTDATKKYTEQSEIAFKAGTKLMTEAADVSKKSGINANLSGVTPTKPTKGKTKGELAQEESTKFIESQSKEKIKLENLARDYATNIKQSEEELSKIILQINIDSNKKILDSKILTAKDRLSIETELSTQLRKQQVDQSNEDKKAIEARKKYYTDMIAQFNKIEKDGMEEMLKDSKESNTKQLTDLQEKYNKGLILEKDYNDEKVKINLEGLQEIRKILILYGQSVVDIDKQIADLGAPKKKNGLDSLSKNIQDATKNIAALFKNGSRGISEGLAKAISGVVQIAGAALNALSSIFEAQASNRNAQYQRTKEELSNLQAADTAYAAANGGLHDKLTQAQIANVQARMAKEEQAAKKTFETAKKIAIAQAILGGLLAVVSVWATQSVIPDPFATILKVVETVAVVALTIAQVSKIKSQQFDGGSATIAPPSVSTPSTSINTPSASMVSNLGQTQMSNKNGLQVQKVYVVESDITRSQRRVAVTQGRSILGH